MDYNVNLTKETQANSFGDYLPNDVLFEAKRRFGSKLRGLLLGLSGVMLTAEKYVNQIMSEYNIPTTTLLIDSFEKMFGIPDGCFKGAGTIEQRRQQILTKIASWGAVTVEEWENIGTMLGFTLTVESGWAYRPDFPIGPAGDKEAKFSVVVTVTGITGGSVFPVPFPWQFGSAASILICVFDYTKPTNVQVLFKFPP